MEVFRHKEHTAYQLSKRIVFFKKHSKMLFWHKGKIIRNHRFSINPHKKWRFFHVLVRLPFFFFQKYNIGYRIGTPNKYLTIQTR